VKILVVSSEFELGDLMTLSWTGTPQIGKPLINTQTKAVETSPASSNSRFPMQKSGPIAMGTADVAYVLNKKNGSPPLSSKRTFAEVVGQVMLIPAPVIREVLGDTLEPDIRLATVDIQYPGHGQR
jgi:hypothetical protein